MPEIEDESGTTIQDEAGIGIEDEAGYGSTSGIIQPSGLSNRRLELNRTETGAFA